MENDLDTIYINTDRALLAVLTTQNAHLIHEYYLENKKRLAPFEPSRNKAFYSLDNWKRLIKLSHTNYKKGLAINFAALDKDSGKMIAGCNFTGIMRGPFQACFLGFSISSKYEGRGLMHEIASAGISYIFNEVGLHRIMSNHLPNNERSARLLKRLGFEKEGYAKSYLKINGLWQDHVLTSLLNPNS